MHVPHKLLLYDEMGFLSKQTNKAIETTVYVGLHGNTFSLCFLEN